MESDRYSSRYFSFPSLPSSILTIVDFPHPGFAVTTANIWWSTTYTSLPSASSICGDVYSLSTGMSLVKGVFSISKKLSYMAPGLLPVVPEGKRTCHLPMVLLIFLFQRVQQP